MLTSLQYRILKAISPGEPAVMSGNAYAGKSKLAILLGEQALHLVPGNTVIDFGCGEGNEAVDLARRGARKVIGIDIRENVIHRARETAARAGVDHICTFGSSTSEKAGVIISLDSFEHFADPAAILQTMYQLLAPGGSVLASFGPTWYHPLGGHLFSVFPWAHLLFSEQALLRWRADFKTDGAARFSEVSGGLNQMTIRRFERLVEASPFRFDWMEPVPIRKLAPLHNRLSREFTTAILRCRLVVRS